MRRSLRTVHRTPLLLLLAAFLVACESGDPANGASDTPTTTATSIATPAADDAEPAANGGGDSDDEPAPSLARIMAHVEHLARELGPRVAAGPVEYEAAEYIETHLDEAGYDTAIEPFTYVGPYDESRAVLPGDEEIEAFMLGGSATGNAHGRPVFAGTGQAEELAAVDAHDRIVLLDRGEITFADKAYLAERAGAAAVVIVNNRPGPFQGTLGDVQVSIPVVSIAQEAREQLHDIPGNGMLTVIAQGGRREQTSQNVAGRSGDECHAYLGAHYDSVPGSPGANDNASGVAMVLELARAYRMDGLCIVAFGAEEVGLWGSQAFVRDHDMSTARFMLNFDMVGKVTRPIIVGDDALTNEILGLIEAGGGSVLVGGSFPPFASSDHVSFTAAGIPAVTIHSGADEHLHTPQDDLDNVDSDSVSLMLGDSQVAVEGLLSEYLAAEPVHSGGG